MTKSTIKFVKDRLERLKFSGKGRFYYAENLMIIKKINIKYFFN